MTATAPPKQRTEARLSSVPVVLTLGRFEGRQMVRHPLFWLAALAAIALSAFELIEEAPVLNRVSMTLAWTMAPLAVAVVFVSGWAVLRARGRTDAHPPMVMPAPMSLRVSGILAGLVWPAFATFGLQLAMLGWTYFRDPVTSIIWAELLVGPVYVAFAGALSVAITRWFPHPSTPLVALFVLAGAQVVVPYNPGNWGSEIGSAALAPIAWPEAIIPYEVAFRPSGLHLAYLSGLALLLVGAGILDRVRLGGPVLGIGLLLAAGLGTAQLGPIDEGKRAETMARLVGDDADLTCEEHDSVTYCPMPGYRGWVDNWERAVEPMLTSVPAEAIEGLEIRQYPVHNTFLFDGINTGQVSWWWVEPAYEDYVARDVVAVGSVLADYTLSYELVGGVASRLIGCDHACEEPSRRIVSLWMSAHDQQVRENVEYQLGEEFGSARVEDCMVAELWKRPNADELIRSNWESLTAPDTSFEEAGVILGVDVPERYDENGQLAGGCP